MDDEPVQRWWKEPLSIVIAAIAIAVVAFAVFQVGAFFGLFVAPQPKT